MLWIIRTLCFTSWIFLTLFSLHVHKIWHLRSCFFFKKKKILQILFKYSCLASEYINIYEDETTTTKKSFSFLHLFCLLPANTGGKYSSCLDLKSVHHFHSSIKNPSQSSPCPFREHFIFLIKAAPWKPAGIRQRSLPWRLLSEILCECVSLDQKTATFIYAAAATFW